MKGRFPCLPFPPFSHSPAAHRQDSASTPLTLHFPGPRALHPPPCPAPRAPGGGNIWRFAPLPALPPGLQGVAVFGDLP